MLRVFTADSPRVSTTLKVIVCAPAAASSPDCSVFLFPLYPPPEML